MEQNSKEIDVLIVGGGPAGTSAALSLLNYSDHSVMLVEQSNLDQMRVGEHVSPSIFDLVEYLKIDKDEFEEGSFIPAYGNTSYWGSDYPSATHSIFTTESSTYQLDREKFDFKLIEKVAERGGLILPRTKCIDMLQLENKHWEITLKHPDQGEFKMIAKYLVDATGRNANICRKVGIPSKKIDSLMGVGAFLKLEDYHAVKQEQILETTELGWWYTALLPGEIVVATFFTDADIISEHQLNKAGAWNALLQQSKQVKQQLKGAHSLSLNPWVRNATSQISDASELDHFIAIGDAASSFDPISSMGIGFAMTSACHAAKLIQKQLAENTESQSTLYQQDILNNFDGYLRLRKQFYQKEKRWASSPFWQRRN